MTTDSKVVRARLQRRYKKQLRIFSRLDRTLEYFIGKAPVAHPSCLATPRKLLVCNYGQLGDMLITLSLLPALKRAFPSVELGVLCGSWNKELVENEPLLTHVHYLDHWHQVRNSATRAQKIAAYARGLVRTLRELKTVDYDTAIDNRVWFPNAILELWLAGIPVRVGYDFDGFAPLLTHVVRFEFDEARHEREYQAAPLACLPIDRSLLDEVPDRWVQFDGNGLEIVAQHIRGLRHLAMSSCIPVRVPRSKTGRRTAGSRLLVRAIAASAVPVLTGLGAEQDALTGRIATRVPGRLVCPARSRGNSSAR